MHLRQKPLDPLVEGILRKSGFSAEQHSKRSLLIQLMVCCLYALTLRNVKLVFSAFGSIQLVKLESYNWLVFSYFFCLHPTVLPDLFRWLLTLLLYILYNTLYLWIKSAFIGHQQLQWGHGGDSDAFSTACLRKLQKWTSGQFGHSLQN